MKIVYQHQYFNTPDMPGGTRSFEMARRWAEAGHEVHVITTSRTAAVGRSWTTTDADGAHIHWRRIPYNNSMSFVVRLWAFIAYVCTAAPRARALRGDVVFATSTPLTVIIPALYATWLRKVPIVFEVRDLWPEMPIAAGHLRNPILKGVAVAMEGLAYRSSVRIIALSEGIAAGVCATNVPQHKIIVAPNSCDVEMFDVSESVGIEYRRCLPWLGERPFVVYCGTLGELNDVGYLVRLAAAMKASHPAVVFGIYGAGKEEASITALAESLKTLDFNVFMMGEIPKREVPAVLSAASVVASVFRPIPEMQANSANKFFDGLAAAKPIVVNYEGWQADLLRSTGAGLVLDAVNIGRAVNALTAFLADSQRLTVASLAARRLAHERFSRDSISRLVLDTIEVAVGSTR